MALVFDSVNGFRDTGTGALTLPQGTTSQRPQNPAYGMMRYNTDLAIIETYGQTANGVGWSTYTNGTFQAEVLLIAGGGGGGQQGWVNGGGGAGGYLYINAQNIQPGTTYPIVIGAGGGAGINGVNSCLLYTSPSPRD